MVRRPPLPVSFIVVTSGVIFLLIFFGAWAVSADVDSSAWSEAFSAYRSESAFGSYPANRGDANTLPPTHRDNFLGPQRTGTNADTWWGKTLITACPFH